jgi:hypothetical protein
MSPSKFNIKIYSITNLIILTLYHKCLYFFYINLVKVQTVRLFEKRELHSFVNGGSKIQTKHLTVRKRCIVK